jgi:hypothetical protein
MLWSSEGVSQDESEDDASKSEVDSADSADDSDDPSELKTAKTNPVLFWRASLELAQIAHGDQRPGIQ